MESSSRPITTQAVSYACYENRTVLFVCQPARAPPSGCAQTSEHRRASTGRTLHSHPSSPDRAIGVKGIFQGARLASIHSRRKRMSERLTEWSSIGAAVGDSSIVKV